MNHMVGKEWYATGADKKYLTELIDSCQFHLLTFLKITLEVDISVRVMFTYK